MKASVHPRFKVDAAFPICQADNKHQNKSWISLITHDPAMECVCFLQGCDRDAFEGNFRLRWCPHFSLAEGRAAKSSRPQGRARRTCGIFTLDFCCSSVARHISGPAAQSKYTPKKGADGWLVTGSGGGPIPSQALTLALRGCLSACLSAASLRDSPGEGWVFVLFTPVTCEFHM